MLGDDFKYDLGILGDCYLDLFFLMVLMNRVPMAKMLWKRCKFPVLSALTACALLRGMVQPQVPLQDFYLRAKASMGP